MVMEIEEIEVVLEKIWDLHDKLSDAIHSISRLHFLNSVKNLKNSDNKKLLNDAVEDTSRSGYVFFKDFRLDDNDAAIQEATSLNAIRTALENLEDQLEFFHTIQIQQRAERDTALARLEQSRIVLAMRLAEHHGKKYKVIEEALAFVGDVRDASRIVSPENLYVENVVSGQDKGSSDNNNKVIRVLFSSFDFVRKSLGLNNAVGGMLGNAALFAVSLIAFLHLHQGAYGGIPFNQEEVIHSNGVVRKSSWEKGFSSNDDLSRLDVLLARG